MRKVVTAFWAMFVFFAHSSQALAAETTSGSVKIIPDNSVVSSESKKNPKTGSDMYLADFLGPLQIGTRMSHRTLTDSESGHKGGSYGSGTFLGTIYALDEEQSYMPLGLFAKLFFFDFLAVEIGYDSLEADTVATTPYYSTDKSDGKVSISGPTISLVGHLPQSVLKDVPYISSLSPYGFVGMAFYSADFEASDHWAMGYHHPTEYAEAGSPSTPLNGHTRTMTAEDADGVFWGVGCTYPLTDALLLDVSARYTEVEVDATFRQYDYGESVDDPQSGTFPLNNWAMRLGIVYEFSL